MQQVVLAHRIRQYLEHGAVACRVEQIAHPQPQGFVAVYRHAGGEKLLWLPLVLRKKIHHLAALQVDHLDALPCQYLNGLS